MREHLFKAKRKDNGEWIFGEYITIYDDPKYKAIKTGIETTTGIYAVDPDTLCEYTGLTDKDGTKIFESDIVTSVTFCPDNEGYAVIQWQDDSARYVLEADNILCDFDNYFGYELEVIGNIFDNADLLEGGGEE